jgi:hypothetical protein
MSVAKQKSHLARHFRQLLGAPPQWEFRWSQR